VAKHVSLSAKQQRTGDLSLIIGERVHDVSGYVDEHPGGRAILQAHAGQDVTQVFRSLTVHHGPAIERIKSRLVILAQTRARQAASGCRAASPRLADTAKI
jgi:cytochrome b involved in lipid metabolism